MVLCLDVLLLSFLASNAESCVCMVIFLIDYLTYKCFLGCFRHLKPNLVTVPRKGKSIYFFTKRAFYPSNMMLLVNW